MNWLWIPLLVLLFLKHFIFDYLWQTKNEVDHKGKYGNPQGVQHSLKHALGTLFVTAFFTPVFFLLAVLDGLIHYHVDWVKMNYGEQDPKNAQRYWRHHGADQYAHTLTYILVAYLAIR